MIVGSPPLMPEAIPTTIPTMAEPSVESYVQLVLSSSPAPRPVCERRRETRHPFPYPVDLTPVDGDGAPVSDETITVLGKHISHHGLDFYSSQPLPFRRAVASFECGCGVKVRLLMDLTWCRFCRHGWYENGGRFLQPITSSRPSDSAA